MNSNLHSDLSTLYLQDLDRLISELNAYGDESVMWLKEKAVNNTAGHLAMHLVGNLKFFIGHHMGGFHYDRNRDNEFNGPAISRSLLVQQIEETKDIIERTFANLEDNRWNDEFPLQVFGAPMTIQFFALRLNQHLSYHLGQISYHRRLLA